VEVLVNINTASQNQLEELPEIGPVTAQRIIAYRETNGPFLKIEDVQEVEGIGQAMFEKIKDLITVGE
jgi:competence protein ComEA